MTAIPRTAEQLSTEWLNESLQDGVFEGAEITHFEVSPVGADVGFLGDICRVKPSYLTNSAVFTRSTVDLQW